MTQLRPHAQTIDDPVDLAGTRLVLFDFDGVVVDSEVISLATLRSALEEFGLSFSLKEVREQFLGSSLASIGEYVANHSPRGNSTGLADAWQSRLFAEFRAGLTHMPDLLPFLDRLDAAEIRFCVASSSSFERLGVALEATGLAERFEHVFSAEQVANGKPAPDLFLFAAQQMNVDPTDCLVIEDSIHGIRAAKEAGMRALGFIGGSHLTHLREEHTGALETLGAESVVTAFSSLFSNSVRTLGAR